MGFSSALLGVGGAIGGLVGGLPSSKVQPPPNFLQTPLGMGTWQDISSASSQLPGQNLPGWTLPQAQSTVSNLYNNPGAGGMLEGADLASALGYGSALSAYGAGGGLTSAGFGLLPYGQSIANAGMGLLPYGYGSAAIGGASLPGAFNVAGAGQELIPGAERILQSGFDPQGALYSRTAQQLTDQTRAAESERGIATTPYGAGIEADQMRKFNIDWQNAQLARQLEALSGAGSAVQTAGGAAGIPTSVYAAGLSPLASLYGQAAGGVGTYGQILNPLTGAVQAGQGLMTGAPGQLLTAASYPYATNQMIGGNQLQDLSQLLTLGSGAQGLAQSPITNQLALMGYGINQNQVANQNYMAQLAQANLAFNQQMALGKALGGGLAGLTGPSGWGTSGSPMTTGWGTPQGYSTGTYGGTGLPGYGPIY